MSPLVASLLFVSLARAAIDAPNVAFKWKQIDFHFPSTQAKLDATTSKNFIPEHNVPLGLEVHGDRIFITLPRWKQGVAASLAYILKSDKQDSPVLRPYPNWRAHDQGVPNPEIVSPFRMRADACDRLWVLDTGSANIVDRDGFKQVTKPKLLIYDLKTDSLIRSYTIPDDQLHEDSFFANIAVEENGCEDNFAYLGDLGQPGLVVYDYKRNTSWIFKHAYFNMSPTAGHMVVANISFEWSDGIFGLALSDKDAEGYSTLYFHPMTSYNEFTVSTKTLRNETLSSDPVAFKNHFKLLGTRGPKSQSGVSFLHQKTGVLFYALVQLNAVLCWRTCLSNYTMESQGRVFMNDEVMVFPNDIKVDDDDTLWVLSDKLPVFMYGYLDYHDYNFRIINATVKDAIRGTACDSKMPKDDYYLKNITRTRSDGTAWRSGVVLPLLLLVLLSLWS
ncbi:unnamed protein product [Phyllotreta striolata]|uniref:Uncharacterized protein n=1 Tax=Phyllotreta striolata TaxID=444603 RepID=A0A9N9TXM4_PHYSR|nr:unnamed protein product [Phyllotreta striolata]